jgi:dolichyl-phosphate beta-glucosyltransferase
LGTAVRPTLSIVVPVFNEERRLPAMLDALRAQGKLVAEEANLTLVEVVAVDDGSTDSTPELLARASGLPAPLRVVRLPNNTGKGAAVRAGMLSATGEIALMTDVDLSTPLDELRRLMSFIDDGADVAIGSRALAASQIVVHQPAHRELMGKTFNLLLRLAAGIPWRDTQCGFKLFRLDRAHRLFELQRVDGFAFDAELLVRARRLGLDVAEVPVQWIDNPDSRVGLVGSSSRMAFDALRIAYWARARARRPPALVSSPQESPRT